MKKLILLTCLLLSCSTAVLAQTFTVVTYNIEKAKKFDIIAENLKAINADIYLLQEVDLEVPLHGNRDTAKELAAMLNYNYRTEIEFKEKTGGYTCQSVLSRFNLTESSKIKLPQIFPWEKTGRIGSRISQKVVAEIDGKSVVFFNSHLEPLDTLGAGRKKQINATLLNNDFDSPAIFGGDLNTHNPGEPGSVYRYLKSIGFHDVFNGKLVQTTFYHPVKMKVDWLFNNALHLTLENAQVLYQYKGTDHYPVSARYSFTE